MSRRTEITTLRTLVFFIHVGGLENFRMDPPMIGCRHWIRLQITLGEKVLVNF